MPVEEGGGQPQNLEALVAKILKDGEAQKLQQQQIDNIESNVRIIGNLICKDGVCTLASKEDLAKVSEKQGTKADLSELSNKELWGRLSKSKVAVQDLKDLHLQKLKEDQDYLKEALGDKELVGKMARLLCDDEGCRLVFNEEVDKAHKNGKAKGQKGESWLVKK